MKGIVWLASYPKSGNTWFRAFLANYLYAQDEAVDINRLGGGPIASARPLFDDEIGVAAADLNYAEVKRLRPLMYKRLGDLPLNFMKVHDAYLLNQNGEPFFPPEVTHSTIYLIRNPLDVAVSYASHNDNTIEASINLMGMERHQLSPRAGGLPGQLPQLMFTWSRHVTSWVDAPDMNVKVVRFEDMKAEPMETFGAATSFIGLTDEPDKLAKAIDFASFKKLKAQEEDKGFREKPSRAKSFFRKGKVGDWRSKLTRQQWQKIIDDHGEVMDRFGYLEDSQWEVTERLLEGQT